MDKTMEALITVLLYNGYGDVIKRLRDKLKENDWTTWDDVEDVLMSNHDSPDRILWSVLSELYGGCGCSPRYGWVEDSRTAYKVLNYCLEEL